MESANPGGQMQPYSGQMQPSGGRGPAPKKKKKKRFSIARFFGRVLLVLFTLCVIGVLTLAIFCKYFMTYVNTTLIPSLEEINLEEMTLDLASTIYYTDANGQDHVMRTLHNSESNRELIKFEDLPKHLVDAMVAIEDHRFWDHKGVDWYGTARATLYSATGRDTQGGSTITQQVVRNITKDKEVTVKRKLREIFRSLDLDAKNSKEDILTYYLNKVYFGHGFSGIQTAAKGYFGKDVSELTLAESACIVGITNYPSLYDPLWDKEFVQEDGSVKTPRDFNKARQADVLNEMAKYGFISEAEAEAAKAEPLNFVENSSADPGETGEDGETVAASDVYSWFEDAVIDDAIDLIAQARSVGRESAADMLYSSGYHIYTTLNQDIQRIVDSVYQDTDYFASLIKSGSPLDSAMTIVDPYTGYVVAMAGGVGQKTVNRGLNLATSPRQPGSSIKPMSIYAPAMEYDVVSPVAIIDDYPVEVNSSGTGGYPKNSPLGYSGPVTVRTGVQRSINTVAVRILQKLTPARSFDFMEQNLGMNLDISDLGPSPLALGGLTIGVTTEQVAAAYSSFLNSGIYTPPRTITRIESNDHSEVIVDTGNQSRTAMKESTAYMMTQMLENAVNAGTGTEARISGMHVAGKTGTTTNKCDRYFAGFTPYYSAAVWTGHAKKNEEINASGNPAAKIWQKVMSQIHEGLPNKEFPDRPEGVTSKTVCGHCGGVTSGLCGDAVSGMAQTSWSPGFNCDCHMEVKICTDPATGEEHLATEFCPEETVTTKVMQKGREFLQLPNGNLVTSDDAMEHYTYFSTVATPCIIHDENYVPEADDPLLEGEGDPNDPNDPSKPSTGTPRPGESGWPTEPYDPNKPTVPSEPGNPGSATTKPGTTTTPGTTTPSEPSEPQPPEEPDEPVLPPEPVLP